MTGAAENPERGQRFATARAAANLTLDEVGDAVGKDRATVHKWEKQGQVPRDAVLATVAKLYGVRAAWLMYGEEPMSEPDASAPTLHRPARIANPSRTMVVGGSSRRPALELADDEDHWLADQLAARHIVESERRRAVCERIDRAAGKDGLTPRLTREIIDLWLEAEYSASSAHDRSSVRKQAEADAKAVDADLVAKGVTALPKSPKRPR